MGQYILRRLGQSVLTVFGVMVITFLLFRVVAGDIAAARLGPKSTLAQRADWRHRYGYDRPLLLNLHRRLVLVDKTAGAAPFSASAVGESRAAEALSLFQAAKSDYAALGLPQADNRQPALMGPYVFWLSNDTPMAKLAQALPGAAPARPQAAPAATSPDALPDTQPDQEPAEPPPFPGPRDVLNLKLGDGTTLAVGLEGARTAGELLQRVNADPANRGRVEARFSAWGLGQLLQTQFFHHLYDSAAFQSRSLKDNAKLTTIIAERAPASLAVQVPALALEWAIGMVIACFVAYYRGSWLDRLGVLLSVLGMCIPFLAFMIYGQWLMFKIAPTHMYGIANPLNVYVPVAIMVMAGLGSQVRFYRTIILDETGRDYVRTARAKGVPLPAVLFKHVLRNCMLPILTSLMLAIPFLFMGGLLVESYFGIPGLGDLMLTSIYDRNEPVMNGMVFLTAVIYTLAVLLTDISCALFDPRIRLK